jgi:hypothetical protein
MMDHENGYSETGRAVDPCIPCKGLSRALLRRDLCSKEDAWLFMPIHKLEIEEHQSLSDSNISYYILLKYAFFNSIADARPRQDGS